MVITIGGEKFVPLRASPLITGGLITANDLAMMLADPDLFCDSENDEVLQAYRYKDAICKPLPIHPVTFLELARIAHSKQLPILSLDDLPPGLIVKLSKLKAMYDFLLYKLGSRKPSALRGLFPAWDESPNCSQLEGQKIFEGLLKPLIKREPVNTITQQVSLINSELDQLAAHLKEHGFTLDRKAMVGQKSQWIKLLVKKNHHIHRASATLEEHLHKAGLRWKRGAQRSDFDQVERILAAHPLEIK